VNRPGSANGIRHIVIAGSGAEAAAAAAALAVSLRNSGVRISLVGPVDGQSRVAAERVCGGGQAFHRRLGIDEEELIRETAASYSLGTKFTGFGTASETVLVPRGAHGRNIRLVPFHHYWCKLRAAGSREEYNEYSLSASVVGSGDFTPPKGNTDPVVETLAYDIVVDPDLYAIYLRNFAAKLGVEIVNDSVSGSIGGPGGIIECLQLVGGGRQDGDFFVDCTSDRQLICVLDGSDDVDDWSGWFHCDRMISVLTRKQPKPDLCAHVIAAECGWLRRLTLQNFTVESLAFREEEFDDSDARTSLEKNLKHPPVGKPELTALRARSWRRPWLGNCVALGPAAVCLEPTLISCLQLALNATLRLLGMLPAARDNRMLATEFNRICAEEHAGARDYTMLHHALRDQPGGGLPGETLRRSLPETLSRRIELFQACGRLIVGEHEAFTEAEWASSMLNLGLLPANWNPLADMADQDRVAQSLKSFRDSVRQRSESR